MDYDEDQVDWDDDVPAQEEARVDDEDDAVSLGDEQEEVDRNAEDASQDASASVVHSGVAPSEPATLSQKTTPDFQERSLSPDQAYSPREEPSAASSAAQPSKMTHALPAKPVASSVDYKSGHGVEATAMSRHMAQKRPQNGSSVRPRRRSQSPRSVSPNPLNRNSRHSRSQDDHYYKPRTDDHSYQRAPPNDSYPRRHGYQDTDSREPDYQQSTQARPERRQARDTDSYVVDNARAPPRRDYDRGRSDNTWSPADESENHSRRRLERPEYPSAPHSQSQSYSTLIQPHRRLSLSLCQLFSPSMTHRHCMQVDAGMLPMNSLGFGQLAILT
jgi:hypothetical protein